MPFTAAHTQLAYQERIIGSSAYKRENALRGPSLMIIKYNRASISQLFA